LEPPTPQALLASVDLFDQLSTRTAYLLGLAIFDARPVRAEIMAILDRGGDRQA
jgi:hypothetical protein